MIYTSFFDLPIKSLFICRKNTQRLKDSVDSQKLLIEPGDLIPNPEYLYFRLLLKHASNNFRTACQASWQATLVLSKSHFTTSILRLRRKVSEDASAPTIEY